MADEDAEPGRAAHGGNTPPSGEVTFLLTDVEGSTSAWERYPDSMPGALARHMGTVRRSVEDHGGFVVKDTGDGVFAAFSRAATALSAAVEAQRALQGIDWGVTGPLRARMGLHSEHAEPIERDYHGAAVNRCARIMAVAHGGQVVVSSATQQRAESEGASGTSFMDLGQHRLRDLSAAMHLYQVLDPDLPADFPPLRSLDVLANNLPAELSTFVGREADLRRLGEMLREVRLLTLTGTGGVGKTRLALQLAADQADRFEGGVWFVDLARLTDPMLVAPEIASALQIGEQPGRSWLDSVRWYLRGRETLLVLDNCEHLLDEVASIVEAVLQSCPRVRIVATSREALAVAGEAIWHVDPLPVSAERGVSEAERLFVERARNVELEFRLEDMDAETLAHICRRLDGIPLAIELASARVKVLSLPEIANLLDERFHFLTGGSRRALPRQRTLEGALAWSYELLREPERRLFDRLSVFAGSFTLDMIEQVCADDVVGTYELLDLVTGLADRSMLVHERAGAPSSYRLLETMRAYGRDRLVERGDLTALRDRHLKWVQSVVVSAASLLQGPEQELGLDRVSANLDDIRLALTWSIEGDRLPFGLACATSLFLYWYICGVREGRRWLDRLLESEPAVGPDALAQALLTHGTLIHLMGEDEMAAATLERSLDLFREIGSEEGEAYALQGLGRAEWAVREPNRVRARFEESLRILRRLGDTLGTGAGLLFLGRWEEMHGEVTAAAKVMDEQAAISRGSGAPFMMAHADEFSAAVNWKATGDLEQGRPLLREALELFRGLGSLLCVAHCVETTAAWAVETGSTETAALLLGATEVLREDAGTPVPPYESPLYEATRDRLRSALGEERLAAEVRRGRSLDLHDTVDAALAVLDESDACGSPPRETPP